MLTVAASEFLSASLNHCSIQGFVFCMLALAHLDNKIVTALPNIYKFMVNAKQMIKYPLHTFVLKNKRKKIDQSLKFALSIYSMGRK